MQNRTAATFPIAQTVARSVSDGGRAVLGLLLRSGGMSQAELTRSLDLSQPTIARLVGGFAADGVVLLSNRSVNRPGNPSVQVTLNPDFAYAIGISLMSDGVSMSLVDFAGNERAYYAADLSRMSELSVLGTISAFLDRSKSKKDVNWSRVIGAGVGISGYYVEGGRFNSPDYLAEWALRDIDPVLSECVNLPVISDNDGTVAAIAENYFGVGRRFSDFAYLYLSNGFGGGIITRGRAMRGYNGNAGEFGGVWTLIEDSYPNLELLKSLVRARGAPYETVQDMVRAIDPHTPGVDEWLDIATGPFSRLSSIISFTIDPACVVIGGRLPHSIANELAARVRILSPAVRRGLTPPAPTVAPSEVVGDPVSIGAAMMPFTAAFF